MSISESLVVTVFSMSLVFAVLAFLFALIKILPMVLGAFVNKKVETSATSDVAGTPVAVAMATGSGSSGSISSGVLKLIDVDEKTAAMIMAIVSDETQIPLSELCFKSIKALQN